MRRTDFVHLGKTGFRPEKIFKKRKFSLQIKVFYDTLI